MCKAPQNNTSLVRYLTVVLMLITSSNFCAGQQKVQFTQYMFNGLVLNPALAGSDEALSLTFLNRNQWTSVDGAPTTQTFSAHTRIPGKRAGVGFVFVNDKIGVHKNQNLQGSFAYHLPLTSQSYLAMGLQAGFGFHKSDYASILTGNQSIGATSGSVAYQAFNMGVGIYYKSPRLEVGLSAPALMPEKYSYSDSIHINWSKSQYFTFIRYRIKLNPSFELQPSMLLKYMEGVPFSYDLNGALVIEEVLTLALAYRKNESIDVLLKAQLTPQLQLGCSYDYSTGNGSRFLGGSYELMVNYVFKYTQTKVASPR